MEDEIMNPLLQNPIYKSSHIQLATFFGGPLAIVYVLAENYKQLGYPRKIMRTWVIGIISFIAFVCLVVSIPPAWHIPQLVIPLISLSLGAAIMQATQGALIKNHIDEGGAVYSLWRSLGVGLICLLITIGIILLLVLLATVLGYKPRT